MVNEPVSQLECQIWYLFSTHNGIELFVNYLFCLFLFNHIFNYCIIINDFFVEL